MHACSELDFFLHVQSTSIFSDLMFPFLPNIFCLKSNNFFFVFTVICATFWSQTMINETEILAVNSAKRTGPVATLCYSIVFILTEVMTQIVPYSFIYFNSEKKFPISSATMIAAIEFAKFIICFLAFCGHQRRVRFVPSPLFFAPAFFFVATGNLFFYCLNFVTPPTWNIILQSRVIFMMFGGYVIYGRPIERRQWLAVGSLLFAILLAGWFCPEVDAAVDIQNNSIKQRDSIVWWTAASICGAVCSAIAMSSSEVVWTIINP